MITTLLFVLLACTDSTETGSDTGSTGDCEPTLELCDDVDNDCDGRIDEDATDGFTVYADADGDGFGDDSAGLLGCGDTSGFVSTGGDCDDQDPAINPDATEVCDDLDNDCDDLVDGEDDSLDDPVASVVYPDADGDGYGSEIGAVASCSPPTDYVTEGGDCDDADPWAYPGAAELCDGKNTDCADTDWVSDAGLASFYSDSEAVWSDVTELLAAGDEDDPVLYTMDTVGTLGLCEGEWHVVLTIEAEVQVIGFDGSEKVILSGDDTRSIVTLVAEDASATISGVTLERGLADHTLTLGDDTRDIGGAVWCGQAGPLSLSHVVLRDNVSVGYGGAIGLDECQLTMFNVTASDNVAYRGGVMFAQEGTVTISESNFANNLADVEGGAIYLGGGVGLVLNDTTFTGHVATQGAAIRAEERGRAGANSIDVSDCAFADAEANQGGAISMSDGGELTIEGTTFTANLAYEQGGALMVDIRALLVSSSVFEGNQAIDDGGAIWVTAEDVEIEGCSFKTNSGEDGGAIHLNAPLTVLTDTSFETNSASRSGGAVAVRDIDQVLEVTGGSFTGNVATRDGGAVYASDSAEFSCESCTFTDNSSERSGGAIGANVANVALQDCTLSNNTAGESRVGGALWVDNGTLTADAVTFDNNLAGDGGAIALGLAVASLASVTFQDNVADQGGGIYLNLTLLDVATSDFSGNSPEDVYLNDADQSTSWGSGASFSCDLTTCE
jgi:predicted outer membrane repeat protein